jgi:hypothetical protein
MVATMLHDDKKGRGLAPLLASLRPADAPNRLPRPINEATGPAMSGASPLERMLRIGRKRAQV